ncbi:hypothetical protein PRIPAC_79614 [Pristionchus pacificus]|uniref:Uncharacterized protein n=1 Tax=Pristionchus pacificus TaxID=54126 RepID=A0A2A6CJ61_PRIPA|nr:hypothetical protein PRIPAC_79614 [Pristionchus pacificus]|eukprot:PDM78242.1 hypothetical protein PRIPAC_30821 [Pristionchus pacificus]
MMTSRVYLAFVMLTVITDRATPLHPPPTGRYSARGRLQSAILRELQKKELGDGRLREPSGSALDAIPRSANLHTESGEATSFEWTDY